MSNENDHRNAIGAGYGTALIERAILNRFSTLWEGPLRPNELDRIEMVLRAFLVSPVMSVSPVYDPWSSVEPDLTWSDEIDRPFDDHLLDYEFTEPPKSLSTEILANEEQSFLNATVSTELHAQIRKSLPSWIKTKGQAFAFIDAWYKGWSLADCEMAAEVELGHDDDQDTLDDLRSLYPESFEERESPEKAKFVNDWMQLNGHSPDKNIIKELPAHAVFHFGPEYDAAYLIACHRIGMTIYADSPIGRICREHVFSKWPEQLFKSLGDEFGRAARELRGPGIAVELPPLLALVLSITNHRNQIPEVLRDLRDEYATSRIQLWDILGEMWTAPTFQDQLKVLKLLEEAGRSIFPAAFPERFDALSLALSVPITPGGVGTALRNIRDHDRPKARVLGVSFAAKLAKDLRQHLLNSRTILRRHLSKAELLDFGME